jgi:hypothetical protein
MKDIRLPTKFRNLMDAAAIVAVPPLMCVDVDYFAREIEHYAEIDYEIARILGEICATSGSALADHFSALSQVVQRAHLSEGAIARLEPSLDAVFGTGALGRERLAVRSAAHGEDGTRRSYAGLYESVLEVNGEAALRAAIERVWRSFFSYPAVLERLKAGRLDSGDRMSVVLQRMVRAQYSGVAFTRDPVSGEEGIVIEVVEGLGEALVSGRKQALQVREADVGDGAPAAIASLAKELRIVLGRLQPLFGADLDVEWSWDGEQVQVLQIRPMTTGRHFWGSSAEPLFSVVPLFEASDEELEPFRPLDEFAAYIRRKRGPLFRFGRSVGAPSGGALLVRCNRAGLDSDGHDVDLVNRLRSDEVVMDSGPRLRQHIVPRAHLQQELRAICARPGEVHQLVIRDFIRGSEGLISRRAADGTVFCEMSADGLLALNRGTAHGRTFPLVEGQLDQSPLTESEARLIWSATLGAQKQLGPCQIEWVIANGRAHVVDYSALSDHLPVGGGNHRVISHGFARGPAFKIDDDDYLRKMSEGPAVSLTGIPEVDQLDQYFKELVAKVLMESSRPIVFAARPFAILAVLIPYVAGFVFESASTLCHLAILLREHGVPGVEVPFGEAVAHQLVTLDTHATMPLIFDSAISTAEAT